MKFSFLTRFVHIIAMTFMMSAAHADSVFLSAIPTPWRLQQYIGGVETVWYTGSPCGSGNLTLGNVTEAERNRFWSLVLAAKLSNKYMFVYYESTSCTISSFGMDS